MKDAKYITFDAEHRVFHLKAKQTSYIMQVVKSGYLAHVYWGKQVKDYHFSNELRFVDRSFSPNPDSDDTSYSLDTLPQEYPSYGHTDFRVPAFQVQTHDGATITDLKYVSHNISKGKPELEGLPATYVEQESEAETLEIKLVDDVIGLTVILTYTVFRDFDAITRSVRFENKGQQSLKLLRALSANVDFSHSEFEMLDLNGSWGRERHMARRPLGSGSQSVESRRGASSHQHNPFIALLSPDATEDTGDIYAFSLVYSGNFVAQAEVDQFRTTRVSIGINPFDFTWLLEAGDAFQCPEVVMVYSSKGLGDMSHTYHELYRTRLIRGSYRDQVRPILINNWEATYFNFNDEKLLGLAGEARSLGIELFVLDDGWFGKRNDDTSSLGDWFVDREKLPHGLDHLGAQIHQPGMRFGLWFEPEMISQNSDLYQAHPDWCLHVPHRAPSVGRTQLVLDFTRKDVRDAIVGMLSDVLKSAPISYVKWDMNRHMTEVGSAALPPERQRETAHRYMLGLYEVMDQLTARFPNILFESCSGGGGRFDPGILYYMPQTWTSDNTDAISRLKIQYGTSLVYPIISMGSHVSAVPNHQVDRMTSLDIRGHVAMSGNLGYELDLTQLTASEKGVIADQVSFYKNVRELVQFGKFHRLLSPFDGDGNETAWMFVSPEGSSEALVFYFKILAEPNAPLKTLKLKGLDPEKSYTLVGAGGVGEKTAGGHVYGGDELMNIGINVPMLKGDYQSAVWHFKVK